MSGILLSERDGAVNTLTLNRPDKRNALSTELVEALIDRVDEATRDGTRLLVLRGEGKSFCAGFDFTGLEEQSDGNLVLRFIRLEMLLQAVHHAPFATIALAHGACYGAGADLVAVCGSRIGAPGTKFRMPGLRFGIALGTRRLAELIGVDEARRLLETSAIFDSEDALNCGFIQEIQAADVWAEAITRASAAALGLPDYGQQLLYQQTRPDRRNADLAALVRSAAAPGLKTRIQTFLAARQNAQML
jgi:enoyl-CoA hydratase/carnithine racemase